MQQSIFYILATALLGGIMLAGVSSADDAQTEEAVFFVQ